MKYISSTVHLQKKIMKKALLILFLLYSWHVLNAQKRFNFGVGVISIYDPFELGVQAKVKFDLYEKTGTAASFGYLFDKNVNWVLDLDQHYNDFVTIGDLGLSPFAGLNLLNTDPKTFWGLNLGLFTDFELDTGQVLYLEPKYTLGKSDRFTLSVGVSF